MRGAATIFHHKRTKCKKLTLLQILFQVVYSALWSFVSMKKYDGKNLDCDHLLHVIRSCHSGKIKKSELELTTRLKKNQIWCITKRDKWKSKQRSQFSKKWPGFQEVSKSFIGYWYRIYKKMGLRYKVGIKKKWQEQHMNTESNFPRATESFSLMPNPILSL